MSTGEDEPSSGLNGRLRPRKLNIPNPPTPKISRKLEVKPLPDKPKKVVPPKSTHSKPDDLIEKAGTLSSQTLCPYCDKIFYSKQTVSKHIRQTHLSSSNQDNLYNCLFCNHAEDDIIRHMVDCHPNQYFACYDCHTRFLSTAELAEHKLNECEEQKLSYRNKLRPKTPKKSQNEQNFNGRTDFENDDKNYSSEHSFNRIVISCEVKPSHPNDPSDIEDNITTNLILPTSKSSGNATVIEKNAVIVLDDLQWNKRIPSNFSFHNTDADQILSRLGVVHRSPRTGESNRREWFKNIDESNQKFEKCFDTSFYSKVASNVQENLTKFLDGSFNFNPDPENTIKTRKAKNSVAINTVEGFPILLACEQFNRNIFDAYLPRAIAPKHKWKWENLESPKELMSPEQIKRDSHTNNCIITLVSSLDIWTQLCMRQKFEEKFKISPLEKKTEKQSIIGKELKEILERRELPASSSQVVKYREPPVKPSESLDFPASLGLVATKPDCNFKPAVLSGEWVRPRCYVCCACGAQTQDSKALSTHISSHHPNAQIQHYEIVGEVLLNSDILKHLYVPPSQINNRTRPLRGFRECTKCRNSISLEDLHQHMLDCAGDTPAVRRKCRYRPFGMRKRRSRLPDNTIRKKIRKDIRSHHNRKKHMRPRPKVRSEVGDAETIRKMLADLPAKRHRALVNPLNPILRPRRKLNKHRNQLVMKKRMFEEAKKKVHLNDTAHDGDEVGKKQADRNDNKIGKTTVKRVASKILRHKDFFTKKNTIRRSRRKGAPNKEPTTGNESNAPSDGEEYLQNHQSSRDNYNSDRININNGNYSRREHGNSNNGSNNRGTQQAGSSSGQSNNFDNSSNQSQNVPLKHSIARLTGRQDKTFYRTYLPTIQQEPNGELVQRMPSEERTIFENEAIVTKLDKPPLHFSHQEMMESQLLQRSKLNKRKGLNDCIDMLRNKLVEPSMGPPSGYSTVQCRSDNPVEAEPVRIERRHSTTDPIIGTSQRSLQLHYPDKIVEETQQNYDSGNRMTRRSQSTRRVQPHKEKYIDIHANNEYLQWKFFYENQMYAIQKSSEHYSQRQSSRRRSSVVPEDLLLQHSINMDMLTGTALPSFPEYHYSNFKPASSQRQTKKAKESRESKAKTKQKNTQPKQVALRNATNSRPRRNTRRKVDAAVPSPAVRRLSENQAEHTNIVSNLITPQHMPLVFPQIAMTDSRINVIENQLIIPTSYPVLPTYQNTHIYQNPPPVLYPSSEAEERQMQYKMHIEPTVSAPLDLTKKVPTVEVQEQRVQYAPEPQYRSETYENFETLDLSKRNSNEMREKELRNTEEVVDLRVSYSSHLSHPLPYTSIPANSMNTLVEDSVSDLTIRQACASQTECYPTDLSVIRDYDAEYTYEKQRTPEFSPEINVVQDLTHSMIQVQRMCHPVMPLVSHGIVIEEPTDLSNKRTESHSNSSTIYAPRQETLNELNSQDFPADLSARNLERKNQIYTESQITEYYGEMVVNNESSIHHSDEHHRINRMDAELNNIHYASPTRPSCTRLGPNMTYLEPLHAIDDSRNISTSNLISPTNGVISYDIPTCNEMVYRHSEIPISLKINSVPDPIVYNVPQYDIATSNAYEHNQVTYEECSLSQYNPVDTSYENIDIDANNPDTPLTIDVVNIESVEPPPCNSPAPNESCDYELIEVEENTETTCDSNKHLPEKIYTDPTKEPEKESAETTKVGNDNLVLEQDPDTARKIAMLPKELVEILGTMPVDHRNQLLNVLPQYVSTSTSPSSSNSVNEKLNFSTLPSYKLPTVTKTDAAEYQSIEISTDDRCSVYNCTMAMSPTTVSSSILLTPPTPQLPDLSVSQQIDGCTDVVSFKCQIESQRSTDSSMAHIDNTSTVPSLLPTRTLSRMEEIDTNDRIIDLTSDDYSAEELETFSDSLEHSVSLPPTPKQKGNNEKTASLRAVRIKTPSERHRSTISENDPLKKQPGNISADDVSQKRTSDGLNPMAIQQAEISSIQYRTLLGTSPISSTLDPAVKNINLINKVKEHMEQIKTEQSVHDSKCLTEKQNIITSSITKATNDELKNMTISVGSISPKVDSVLSSKIKEMETPIQTKGDNVSSITAVSHNKCVEETHIVSKTSIEDEDSDDDVTLASIVKKKNQKCNLTSEENDTNVTDLADINIITKNKEVTGQTHNENSSILKKNNKGLRVFVNSKSVQLQDELYKSIAQDEVDKENTISSGITNNNDNNGETVKSKSGETEADQSVEKSNRSVNDVSVKITEKSLQSVELNDDNNSLNIKIIITNIEDLHVPGSVKVSSSNKLSCDSANTHTNLTPGAPGDDMLQNKVKDTIDNVETRKSIEINENPVNMEKVVNQSEETLQPSAISVQSDRNMGLVLDNLKDSFEVELLENSNEDATSTPLRRSGRVKSLFINNTSESNILENCTEHKTPLTKKQLIFSKLLDEENHSKIIKSKQEKIFDKCLPDKQLTSICTNDIEIDKETSEGDKNINKRKKSPQRKRKHKKNKSLYINESPETDVDVSLKLLMQSDVKSPEISIDNVSPTVSHKNGDKNNSKSHKNYERSRSVRTESSLNVENLTGTKRKSSSPEKFDQILSVKPKKTKLNDEVCGTRSPTTKITDVAVNENKPEKNKGNDTAGVVSRNTTCYSKPATKRVRSKSVVVKSSGADLYDPYDIDLEDMAEKTEPFIRRETTSKVESNSIKPLIIAKTKKLTKTVPSAIIDISPLENSKLPLCSSDMSTENNNLIKNTGSSDHIDASISSTNYSHSDSDESSKSDVPLKKYVEEKERKILIKDTSKNKLLEECNDPKTEVKNKAKSKKSKPTKKNECAKFTYNEEDKAQPKEDNEKELRSEQFMESFGFFSERKPRKSNLLASKKISETFHIIANESDDVYFESKEKSAKKTNNKKDQNVRPPTTTGKRSAKRGRKKSSIPSQYSFCDIFTRILYRFDNYLRHQLSLIHISKFAEVNLKLKTVKIGQRSNYFEVYKRQLDRLKVLQNKIAKRKKNCLSTADIILPTLEQILAEVKRTVREQQLSRRGLSQDQALFLDCCEMLKESHASEQPLPKRNCNSFNCVIACQEELALLESSISDDCDMKCDDIDSIIAKNILESEEVRNLEADLIFNLKEANGLKGPLDNVHLKSPKVFATVNKDAGDQPKLKRQKEVKNKMYPDVIENIDMYEDKFDKIKRKCRSQAAAAKHTQSQVETKVSYKIKKKSEKKKGRRNSKKSQCTVPTKAALKGFDGIKVSILTSDINISALVPSLGKSFKKKKKSSSKKKRDRKMSNGSSKYDSDQRANKETPQKEVDVYEFMDTEDAELFEFRPSTLMERFKSIKNKETSTTSNTIQDQNDAINVSSDSASDGDDFVYMSDDYVCSDDETENSILSCELGIGPKKSASPLKRKDIAEKNAVMGKIFKQNALRNERISPKRRETPKLKTNLDQLFDSLLEEEPKPSSPPKEDEAILTEKSVLPTLSCNQKTSKHNTTISKHIADSKIISESVTTNELPKHPKKSPSSSKRKSITPPRKIDLNFIQNSISYELLPPNRKDNFKKGDLNGERRQSTHRLDTVVSERSGDEDERSAKEDNTSHHSEDYNKHKSKEKLYKNRENIEKRENENRESVKRIETLDQTYDDAVVATQRVRRKCTVGKQNVLAETWSSESEPDGAPHRPNSAESVLGSRKKRSRKKDMSCSRKANKIGKVSSKTSKHVAERTPRPRAPYYWSDGEEEQEHPQQHGWIVGDSHKKLVTMLAHAKGRKRHDDRRTLLE